jgi:hypothetical protein
MTFPKVPVVLSLAAGNTTVPIQGTIIGESEHHLRLRTGTVEIDILKSMVRAIRQSSDSTLIN